MSEYIFKLPDLGEGTVEAEIVEWHVQTGDTVEEGQVIVDVMTDKANVEVPAPVSGRVLRTSGEPGDLVAVGSELIALETAAGAQTGKPQRKQRAAAAETEPPTGPEPQAEAMAGGRAEPERPAEIPPPPTAEPKGPQEAPPKPAETAETSASGPAHKVITSPAIRKRAKEAGIDLAAVRGSGPRGRILRRDLEAHLESGAPVGSGSPDKPATPPADAVEEIKVIGVRRVIAERMSQSKREIPHFSYVEEVDVSELEALRRHLNETRGTSLTVLPFVAAALIRALEGFPQCNARFDAESGVLKRFRAVHLGIATHTSDGLKVPVVHGADTLNFWNLISEIVRVTDAARDNAAMRGELVGSTVTLTSLGRMGGIVSTPVINYPEVAIVGINKAVERPMVMKGEVRIRTMMNLSGSFDHRFVDGFDAASLIQAMREHLEHPATLFMPDAAG